MRFLPISATNGNFVALNALLALKEFNNSPYNLKTKV